MSGIYVGLGPAEWQDVLGGLGLMSKQAGMSDTRRYALSRVQQSIVDQMAQWHVDPPEALRRDYDRRRVECEVCETVGLVPVVQDGVERWTVCPACEGKRVPA